MPMPAYLRTALRLALLTGAASGCGTGPYVPPYDGGPDYCAVAAAGDPCPSAGLRCGYAPVPGHTFLNCEQPPFQNPRWVELTVQVGGPLLPPELPT